MNIYLLQQVLLHYLCTMKIEDAIKQSAFLNSYHKMVVNLIFTGNWIRDEQVSLLKEFDLLPQHYNALRIIKGRHPKPISPKEIKEVLVDKANDLTRLLDKLEKKQYIKRNLCPSNRRKMDISITDAGLGFLRTVQEPMDEFTDLIRKRVTENQAEELSQLLDLVRG